LTKSFPPTQAKTPEDYETTLPTMASTAVVTAILEAGRRSLDHGSKPVTILEKDGVYSLQD
jgi:hypothetical protein